MYAGAFDDEEHKRNTANKSAGVAILSEDKRRRDSDHVRTNRHFRDRNIRRNEENV